MFIICLSLWYLMFCHGLMFVFKVKTFSIFVFTKPQPLLDFILTPVGPDTVKMLQGDAEEAGAGTGQGINTW